MASARKPSLIGCCRSSEEAIVEAIYISESGKWWGRKEKGTQRNGDGVVSFTVTFTR